MDRLQCPRMPYHPLYQVPYKQTTFNVAFWDNSDGYIFLRRNWPANFKNRILSSDLLQLLERLQGDPQLLTVLPGSQLELIANMDIDRLSVVDDRAKTTDRCFITYWYLWFWYLVFRYKIPRLIISKKQKEVIPLFQIPWLANIPFYFLKSSSQIFCLGTQTCIHQNIVQHSKFEKNRFTYNRTRYYIINRN